MRVVTRLLLVLGIGIAVVAFAAAVLAWQLPALHGTITIGDGDVTLKGFDDPDGENAGLAMALAGVAVVGIVVAALVAAAVAIVVGLGAALLAIALALLAVAGSIVLVASPLLLAGWLLWVVLRRPGAGPAPRPTAAAALVTS